MRLPGPHYCNIMSLDQLPAWRRESIVVSQDVGSSLR